MLLSPPLGTWQIDFRTKSRESERYSIFRIKSTSVESGYRVLTRTSIRRTIGEYASADGCVYPALQQAGINQDYVRVERHPMTEPANFGVLLQHNLRPEAFMWLWMKYTTGLNDRHHCTNCLRGPYSKILSKPKNPHLGTTRRLVLDEVPVGSYRALYICGVAARGYRKKENYPHNLHAPIQPEYGVRDTLRFEDWQLDVENGRFLPIIGEDELPPEYRGLPPEYTTCRIFRWAAGYFSRQIP